VLPAAPPPALGWIAAVRSAEAQAVVPVPVPVPVPLPEPVPVLGVDVADDELLGVVDDAESEGAGASVTVLVAVGELDGVLAAEQPASPAAAKKETAMRVIFVVVRMGPACHSEARSVDQSEE
jgi:hypothetical protein